LRATLYETHRQLVTILHGAREQLQQSSGDETAWAALAYARRELDRARAELLLLEDAPIPEVLKFLGASPSERDERIHALIQTGGLVSRQGKFLELDVVMPSTFRRVQV
jgi:hypothetical protein